MPPAGSLPIMLHPFAEHIESNPVLSGVRAMVCYNRVLQVDMVTGCRYAAAICRENRPL